MDNFERERFADICRTCAIESKELIYLFASYKVDRTQAEILSVYTQTPIFETDDRPKGICQDCVFNLNISYDFLNLVQRSEEKFAKKVAEEPNDFIDLKRESPGGLVNLEVVKVECVDETEIRNEISTIFVDSILQPINVEKIHKRKSLKKNLKPALTTNKPATQRKQERIFECYECRKRFESKKELRMHLPEHHTKYPCRICVQRFTKQGYEQHSCKRERMQCELCTESFETTFSLLNHLETHNLLQKFKCWKCGRRFPMRLLFEYHKEICLKDYKKLVCDICCARFRTKYSIRMHMETVHENKRSSLCSTCGKNFRNMSTLKAHMKRHNSAKTVTCSLCPSKFYDKYALKNHMEVHKDEKYVCNQCGSVLRSKGSFDVHIRRHKNKKIFTCEGCLKQITTSLYHLRLHMQTHTGEKPYKCKFCDRAYGQNADLNKHMRAHVGENTYPCTMCTKAFRLLEDLRRHYAEHYKGNENV